MRVLITRPRYDSEDLAAELAAAGVQSLIDPLLDIRYLPGEALDLTGIQGLLMTSANGVRAFCRRSDNRSLTVYAVGDASASVARDHGFTSVFSATGDVDALADLVLQKADPSQGALLHCAGTAVAGDLARVLETSAYSYRRDVLYQAVTSDHFSADTVPALESGKLDGVLLYSPRTAGVFANLIGATDLLSVTAYCLSENVDKKIDHLNWKKRWVADVPESAKLVAAVIADAQT